MSEIRDTAEGSGESDIGTWLKENKLSSLLKNESFTEQELTIDDIRGLKEDEIKFCLCLCEDIFFFIL